MLSLVASNSRECVLVRIQPSATVIDHLLTFSFIFGLFKQSIQFLQQINVKKWPSVHPVYGAGIRTHDLILLVNIVNALCLQVFKGCKLQVTLIKRLCN